MTQALAKITGAILATTLVSHGEDALGDAVRSIAKTVELEARRTASMVNALEDDSGDSPEGTIN